MSEISVEQLNLGDLIAMLGDELAKGGDRVLPVGFRNPHSYRGDYCDLAFEPCHNVALSEMLQAAQSAYRATYQGWKCGDFVMTEYTLCWLAYRGEGCGETIGLLGLRLLLAKCAEVS